MSRGIQRYLGLVVCGPQLKSTENSIGIRPLRQYYDEGCKALLYTLWRDSAALCLNKRSSGENSDDCE